MFSTNSVNSCNFGARGGQAQFLNEKLQQIEDKQGILGNAWNGFKELTTLGVSESDCEKMLDKYNSGEISFDEAVNYLDEFNSKQGNMSSLLSNIATGVGAIAIATSAMATGGLSSIGWGLALKAGAPIGAALKTGINLLDRATNDVEDDAFDLKQMTKDAISGAVTGATSAVSSGVGIGIKEGKILTSVLNGAKCGLTCGAISGSSSYMADVAFGDKEFDAGNLFKNTATSALVSGAVGAAVGAGMYGMNNLSNNEFIDEGAMSVAKNISQGFNNLSKTAQDAVSSSARKILGTETKEVCGLI